MIKSYSKSYSYNKDLYILIYTGNLCVQSKIIRKKWTHPSLIPVFLIAEKQQSLAEALKFSDFQFVLWKIQSNCKGGLFCIANLLEVGRKTFF